MLTQVPNHKRPVSSSLYGLYLVNGLTTCTVMVISVVMDCSCCVPSAGFIQEDYLRELLTTMGDRFTDEEVDELFREAPIDKKNNFNYVEFTRILKHGAKDKDD